MRILTIMLALVVGLLAPPASAGERCTELQDAAMGGETGRLRWLLDEGVSIDCRDPESGETALMGAAFWAQPEAAAVLLRYGADVNAQDDHGNTVLDYADMGWFAYEFMGEEDAGVEARFEELARLLRQAGGLFSEEF